MLNILHQTNS